MGFCHQFSPCGLNTVLAQGWVFENGSHCGNSGQSIHSKDRGRVEEPPIACGSRKAPSMTFPNTVYHCCSLLALYNHEMVPLFCKMQSALNVIIYFIKQVLVILPLLGLPYFRCSVRCSRICAHVHTHAPVKILEHIFKDHSIKKE